MKILQHFGMLLVMYGVLYVAIANGFGVTMARSSELPQVAGATSVIDPNNSSLIEAINKARSLNGKTALNTDQELLNVANYRANDMVDNSYYSHIQPDGTDYYSLFDQRRQFSCENLNLTIYENVDKIIEDWMNSDKGHRECLLDNRATKIGVSIEKFEQADIVQYMSVVLISS